MIIFSAMLSTSTMFCTTIAPQRSASDERNSPALNQGFNRAFCNSQLENK